MTEEEKQALEAALATEKSDKAALEETNKKLFARAKTAEGFIQDSDGNWVKKDKPADITTNPSLKPVDILRDDAFKLYRMGYDEKEIDIIVNNGGIKILDDKDNPITLGIEARKQQRGAEDAVSRTNSSSQLSEVERKYTPEQLKNMSTAELEKILPHA